MRLVLKQRISGQIEFGIIYGCIVLIILCAARFMPLQTLLPDCAFRGLTGIPCPTCGTTRCMVHVAYGNFASAFLMSPLAALATGGAVIIFIYSIFSLVFKIPRLQLLTSKKEATFLRICAATIFLLNWTYLIAAR